MHNRVTFIHAADLHLDAPFAELGASNERVGKALAGATYAAFERIVDVCIERAVDFLVLAGDSYNCADKSLRAQLRFRAHVQRLADAGIEVFVVHGNHDPVSGWSAGLELPEAVHVFPADRVGRFEVVRDGEAVAAIYGRSFRRAGETENLAAEFRREVSDSIAIAVLHANVGGYADYDPYAPATLTDLRAAGMDYWALGHIHKQEILSRDPWVAYSGSPQGLSPKELGAHGCLLVEIAPGGTCTVEHIETAAIVWAQSEIDVSEAATLEEVSARISAACDQVRRESGRPAILRVTLRGRTGVHGELARPGALSELTEFVRDEQLSADPFVWLDRLTDRTIPPLDIEAVRGGADFAAELVHAADELLADPAALEAIVADTMRPVSTTLAAYSAPPSSAEVLERARDLVLDQLLGNGGR
ncbi:MAG: exonuclease SbcCD subunit D [Coriobacteriia bacterium]